MSFSDSVLVALFCFIVVFVVLFLLFILLRLFTHLIVWVSRSRYFADRK